MNPADVDRLVEQAHAAVISVDLETERLLSGLTDAVEDLQRERGSLAKLVAEGAMPFVKSQVALKARVDALEAGLRDLLEAFEMAPANDSAASARAQARQLLSEEPNKNGD